ncbi:hypothetical protein [Kangiella spongicola]|uniref:Uncharacterized protein n=1 Tax=Kangiella spongicola TaxID=796379 RepID=A0A318D313_9GAMM|nr:hypothetical protein [Kangiella spongicola]PXF63666.1 hypothetical protein DL796_00500 [Kangiella spongicola]
MKLLKKASLIIVVVLIALVVLLQFDDSLKPETKAWKEKTEQAINNDNDAYFYFLGMMAPEDKDPVTVGKEIHSKVKAQPIDDFDVDNVEESRQNANYGEVYRIKDGLTVHKPRTYCRAFIKHCFETLLDNPSQAKELVTNNKLLKNRYRKFLEMPNYQQMHPMANWKSIPSYQSLIDANNLALISLLTLENSETINQQFSTLMNQTRHKLTQSGSIMEKMIFVAIINHNLEFYNLLYTHNRIESPLTFDNLSKEEKDFEKAMSYELLSGSAVMNHYDFKWYRIVARAVIKKNIMLNKQYEYAKAYSAISRLPAHEQIQPETWEENLPEEDSFLQKYRNYSGWILHQIAKPAYNDYIYRVSGLDAKIGLLNWRLQQTPNAPIDQLYLESHSTETFNPYQTGAFIIKADSDNPNVKRLCIERPTKIADRNHVRCIQL